MWRGGRRVLLMLAIAVGPAVGPAAGPAPDSASETYKDWVVGCSRPKPEEPLSCAMVQSISLKETGQTVVRLAFQSRPGGGGLDGSFVVPLGTGLTAGLKVQIDEGRPILLGYEQCLPQGCIVRWKADGPVVDALRRGRQLKVTVEDADANKLDVPMSLLGFTEALGALAGRR